MVTAQYYLEALKSVMPERLKEIRWLREEKQKFDAKVLAGQDLSPEDVKQLISIIGKDAWYSKAEERSKLTLRRLTYKLIKSAEAFERYHKRFEAGTIPQDDKSLKYWRMEVDSLNQFFLKVLPNLKQRLQKLDLIYQQQVLALQKMLDERKQVQVYARLAYRKALNEEHSLFVQHESWYNTIKGKVGVLVNLIKTYSELMKEGGESLVNEYGRILVYTAFGIFLLTQVVIHISERGFVMEGNWFNLMMLWYNYSAAKFGGVKMTGELKRIAEYSLL